MVILRCLANVARQQQILQAHRQFKSNARTISRRAAAGVHDRGVKSQR
jgi:hypothetical protein